jgi:thiol-disulfide isomerase/thioredoxin
VLFRSKTALVCVAMLLCTTCAAFGQPAATPASKPSATTAPTAVPQDVLDKMDAIFKTRPSPTGTMEEKKAEYAKTIKGVLEIGAAVEKEYPDAANLHLVRGRMLTAADMIVQLTEDKTYEKTVLEIAHRMLGESTPVKDRLAADLLVMRYKMKDEHAKPQESADQIKRFVARYADSNVAAPAVLNAVLLASQAGLDDLTDELVKTVKTKYADEKGTKEVLAMVAPGSNAGKPFTAELTRMDGSKLSLPKDLEGKVVVIDFWATWCGPCVGEIPHMKEIYAKYKDKGVEFVGISLDKTKDPLEAFVKDKGLAWTMTYDGQQNPAATKYKINSIPAVWVVGKDGKIVTETARGRLEHVLDKALGVKDAPTSTATTQPATDK